MGAEERGARDSSSGVRGSAPVCGTSPSCYSSSVTSKKLAWCPRSSGSKTGLDETQAPVRLEISLHYLVNGWAQTTHKLNFVIKFGQFMVCLLKFVVVLPL